VLDISTAAGAAVPAVVVALAAVGAVVFYYAVQRLEADLTAAGGSIGDPTAIDLANLDAAGVRAAPPEVFDELSEADALEHADSALEAGDKEKARAILDRFDEGGDASGDGDASEGDGGDDYGVVTQRTAGVVDAFSEEDTDEDDIGGYYTDIAFIADSLTSKSFRIAGVFMAVMGATFFFLYRGGIRVIKEAFLGRMPPEMVGDVDLVTLHPVEALIFEIKFATLVAAVSTLPIILYYAWPALRERGFAGGDRRVLLVWGGTLVVGMAGGSLLGFFYVAPTVLSWLATDALQSHMVISYRINNFGWLVIALTVGIGLLAEIPVTMFLFHRGGLVPFATMFERWRVVVVGIVVVAAVATPGDLLTMLLFAVPISLSFGVGLAILWVYTLGGRRAEERQGEPAD
jgi:sec-independent protein translocase protein TatC